jgi:Gpi18-like mannosyltransferase
MSLPPQEDTSSQHRRNARLLVALVCLCLVVRLVPAYFVYGSFDVGSWELVIRQFREGNNPYETAKLNWPPLWPMMLYGVRYVEDLLHLPTHFSVKLLPCLFDTAIAVVLYGWFARTASPLEAFKRSLWYALNPVAIATCALQGQFESIPSLFSMLAILSAERSRPDQLATVSALLLGLGGMAKTWPLVLVPALVRRMRSPVEKVAYAMIAVAPAIVGVGAVYLLSPAAVTAHVLNYRGAAGQWGLTALNFLLSKETEAAWSHVVLLLLFAAWGVVYLLTWKRGTILEISLLALLTFYVFSPDCGTHHHVWFLGIAMMADLSRARIYTILASIALGVVYVFTPYNGELFNYISLNHTALFWETNLNRHHLLMSAIVLTPLWAYFVYWWLSRLREVAIRRSNTAVPSTEPDRIHPVEVEA